MNKTMIPTKKQLSFLEWEMGIFIHFGIRTFYEGHVDWDKKPMPLSAFTPCENFTDEWMKVITAAGFKYAILTTRHHDGFCNWRTKTNKNNVAYTPWKNGKGDVVSDFVNSCRKYGVKAGLYYSPAEWDFEKLDPKEYDDYVAEQLTELMTNYGKIDILWLDFSYGDEPDNPHWKPWMKGKGADDWESEKLIATVRKYQPDIIIDNRSDIDQDIWTPEQFQPTEWPTHKVTGELVPWEACQTFSGSWGYFRDETNWKSEKMVVAMLIKTVALGGNLIMNVGPTSRGYIDKRAEKMLDAYAEWMKYNSRSIYGCTKAEPEFTAPDGCALTQSEDGSRLYIHILNYPFQNLQMDCIAGKIDYAQFLHDGSEVSFKEKADCNWDVITNTFWLPTVKPDVLIPVIEVFLKKENS